MHSDEDYVPLFVTDKWNKAELIRILSEEGRTVLESEDDPDVIWVSREDDLQPIDGTVIMNW